MNEGRMGEFAAASESIEAQSTNVPSASQPHHSRDKPFAIIAKT
jgi:hypothetical protein